VRVDLFSHGWDIRPRGVAPSQPGRSCGGELKVLKGKEQTTTKCETVGQDRKGGTVSGTVTTLTGHLYGGRWGGGGDPWGNGGWPAG